LTEFRSAAFYLLEAISEVDQLQETSEANQYGQKIS
jgi:hypothetical protein